MSIFSATRTVAACAIITLAIVDPALAQRTSNSASAETNDPLVGEYVSAQHELVAGLSLNPDGTFAYGLSVGSLDERARGRWMRVGSTVELVSDPRPVPPAISAGAIEAAPGKPFAIRLTGPNGADIPGVDVLIEFDSGEPLHSYLAGGPWSLPTDDVRQPRFVTFSNAAYHIRSGPMALRAEAGTIATFLLTPNDFGVVDLTGARLEPNDDGLTLIRSDGSISFTRRTDR